MDRDVKQNIAENAPIENPPEGGTGRDPLQDLSPEARTFEVFQLLKKSADQDRKEEKQKLFPNNTLRDPVFCFFQTSSPFDTL